jgi:hypothetical protein
MLKEYAIINKLHLIKEKKKNDIKIFILLQQQKIKYIQHLYMMKNILELMFALQLMLY